ncbi:hypothetical protein SORBI_3007G141300 [Sorghum bicolor]|uniref:Uncharacterized protein n=1 Tax=Sorghum bicolor TaxID=4558 RepID=A0A1B6PI25_SORBI|nr:hypothetical protein SORBI_3007G141300 [Sorghum bicolor]
MHELASLETGAPPGEGEGEVVGGVEWSPPASSRSVPLRPTCGQGAASGDRKGVAPWAHGLGAARYWSRSRPVRAALGAAAPAVPCRRRAPGRPARANEWLSDPSSPAARCWSVWCARAFGKGVPVPRRPSRPRRGARRGCCAGGRPLCAYQTRRPPASQPQPGSTCEVSGRATCIVGRLTASALHVCM